jgi:hypothetical protein
LHRVIGGYIDVFSHLTAIMRQSITSYFALPDEVYPLRVLPLLRGLFATMTAKPIVESFFGLSTYVGELDEAEIAVRNALRRNVDDHVSFRNDLVHADWIIGWENAETSEPIPDTAYKVKTKAGVPTFSDLEITPNRMTSSTASTICSACTDWCRLSAPRVAAVSVGMAASLTSLRLCPHRLAAEL